MVTYIIQVRDSDGTHIGEFQRFRKLKFNKRLNNYGQCSFEVPVNDSKVSSLIALRRYSVYIYRKDDLAEDTTPQLVWSGQQALREGNLNATADNWVSIRCYDWFELLRHRYTDTLVTYTTTDAGEIAWDLINTSQIQTNGNFGIIEGDIEATQDRDREYKNYNIADAIINLSNVINGFDFEINTSKVFNVYAQQGIDRTDSVILEYGINIRSVRIVEDFTSAINRAIVLGKNEADFDNPLREERDNLTSQGTYQLFEGLQSEPNVIEVDTLQEKGDAMLRKYQDPLMGISMDLVRSSTPIITDFGLGDIIRIKVQTGIYDLDDSFRIYEWEVSYDEQDTETLNLVVARFII